MPADYLILVEHMVVVSRGTGVFTKEDYINHMKILVVDPLFKPTFSHLVDCRSISTIALTSDDIREVAVKSVFGKGSRRAFVVSSDLHFGLSRMLAAYGEIAVGHEIGVFREMEQALTWLKLPATLNLFAGRDD